MERDFDILTISETWFTSSVSNSVVEIPGYKVYRLDRLGKAGAGVCAYVKSTLKVKVLKDLTEISESGLHQLWIQVQNKKLRSLLVCIVYRPPEIGIACLENELLPKYIEALSRNKDIVLTGDLNCDLLSNNPRGEALLSFCATVNATQLIDKPTRVTENSRSLLDVILVSDPVLVKSSGVLEITISDHFLVYVVINLRSPKQAPTYIVTRTFRNYKADQFANDIAHIPWDTMNLIDESVDNSLDAFNDLLLACLDDHAPIKTVKIRHKPNPFITADIRDLMKVRDRLHKRARETGMSEDWEVFKELRNRVKFVLRKAEREYYNQQIYENKNNSGAMWKTIRSALPNKSGRPSNQGLFIVYITSSNCIDKLFF